MWNPWQTLRDEFPDWQVRFVELPDDTFGATDHRHKLIWMSDRLNRAERRTTLAHELIHVREGHDGPCSRVHEEWIEDLAARELIPLGDMLKVLPWANSLNEAADELQIDTGSLHIRLKRLHPAERAALRAAFAARDCEDP